MSINSSSSSFGNQPIADKKQVLLQLLLEKKKLNLGRTEEPIVPVFRDSHLPLSFAQQRLWFLDQLKGANAIYNMPTALRMIGPLDPEALQQCVDRIVQRHEALRTTFQAAEGSAVQVIAEQSSIPIELVNLDELEESEQPHALQRLLNEEAERPFDLANDSLLRVTLLRLRDKEHVLLFTMHHIISDDWSMGIFVQEVTMLYEALTTDTPTDLPELPIQYADFSYWQRQWLQGEVLQTQVDYWKQQLDGASPLLELPTDRPRPSVQSSQGCQLEFSLPPELTEQLQRLSQKAGATLFMTLLSAFQVLMHRYSGQSDIVVGSPIANRNRREIEGLIGFFVNTLALRTQVDGQQSFEQLLQQVRKVTLDAYAHQDLPFEKLVEELRPERSLSYSALFQVMFVLQNTPIDVEALELPDLQIEPLDHEATTAKFDLTLSLAETDQGLVASWEYNTDLLDRATVKRMHRHFQVLLEGIVSNPLLRIAELPLLTETERAQVLFDWNDTEIEFPSALCIHQLFEQQVEQTPEAIAVVFEEKELTYHELNQKANQLAHHLQSLGIGPDVLVGLCVERSLEMVIGLLGILKAGGAYVPLDPNYPQERLAYMLEDTQVPVLITQLSLADNLPTCSIQVLFLEELWPTVLADYPQHNPVSEAEPSNLAYVIYTSGSTGIPKGVMIPHCAVCNHLHWMQTAFPLETTDRVLQQTAFSFDVSVWEIYAPLLVGAQLVMARPGGHQDVDYLIEQIVSQEISTLQLVPALMRMFLEHEGVKECTSLKHVFCGGEALPIALQEHFFTTLDAKLHNLYGLTETCIDSIVWTCQPGMNQSIIPIGRPIANTTIYLLDEQQQPVPIGVAGEIYIGGAGVARGYLNRPELTAEKFIPNPFSNSPQARLYRTGDLGRYLADGNVEYIGRIDNQVKLRGFRIELGEVEAALEEHPQVEQAIVVMQGESVDDKRLVGYVVITEAESRLVDMLREYIQTKLPEYMVPSSFMLLEKVPLTPNGKIDHKALPQLDLTRRQGSNLVLPRNSVELQLASIWEQILNVHPIGVQDNFFELGGHSLLAIGLMAKIEQCFEKNLSLAKLFQNPTIEQLANIILSQSSDHLNWSPLVAIQPNGSKMPFFCVPGSAMDVIEFYYLAHHLGSDQPFYGLQPRGLDGKLEPHTQIEDIAACHIEALQTVQPLGPYYLGGHSFGVHVAFEMAQQLIKHGHEVAFLAIMDTPVPTPILENPADFEESSALALTGFVELLEIFSKKTVGLSQDKLLSLGLDEQLDYVSNQLELANLLPLQLGKKQLQSYLKVSRADEQALSLYLQRYDEKRNIHLTEITLFRALDQIESHEEEKDDAWGWNDFSIKSVDIHFVPGDHATMMTEPHVITLAKQLRNCIGKTQNGEA
jgi:amino acid adenylation domain-containing protein